MTFKEKLIQEHPEKDIARVIDLHCPDFYGYEKENYLCDGQTCDECWNREMPEERNDDMKKEFTKADLKDGMVVEYRNGERRIVVDEVLYGLYGFASLKTHCNDLTYSDSDLDIVKVYAQKSASLNNLFKYPGEIIWERKEEPVTKDVSLEELNAILKEKFPDIDKFNLPIKERSH